MIRIIKKFSCICLLLLFILPVFTGEILAAESYTVKPLIIIPLDWTDKIFPTQLEQHKSDILTALQEVQTAYAQKLNGKTFNFDSEVTIIYSKKPTPAPSPTPTATPSGIIRPILPPGRPPQFSTVSDFLFYLMDNQPLPSQDGVVSISWVIGSGNLIQTGGERDRFGNSGSAEMNNENLLDINPQTDLRTRDMALALVAHELGHAFGLVFDGWAKAHPCSQVSINECLARAPNPLPRAEEYFEAIMGRFTNGLSNSHFNNSTYNPEICKLFSSPFINPGGEACPKPSLPLSPDEPAQITSLTPNPIKQGEILEIKGEGFGEEQGSIRLYNPYISSDPKTSQVKVIQWTNELIQVLILREGDSNRFISNWKVRIFDKTGESKAISDDFLTINNRELPPLSVVINYRLTCGPDQKTMVGANVSLINAISPQNILVKAVSQADDNELAYTIDKSQTDDIYLMVPESFEDVPRAEPESLRISLPSNIATYLGLSVKFHYRKCPAKLENQLAESQTPTGTAEEVEQSVQLLISNYPDFRDNNAPSDQGSETMAIERIDQSKEIAWELSTIENSEPVYIREIYEDGIMKDYEVDLEDNQVAEIGEIKIEAENPPDVVEKIEIEGPEGRIDITNEDSFDIDGDYATVFITYSSGKVRLLTYRFNQAEEDAPEGSQDTPAEDQPEAPDQEFTQCPAECSYYPGEGCFEGPKEIGEEDSCSEYGDSWYNDSGQCWRKCE